jgi:hypothetical protein
VALPDVLGGVPRERPAPQVARPTWLRALKIDPSNAEAQGFLAKARPALELAEQHL